MPLILVLFLQKNSTCSTYKALDAALVLTSSSQTVRIANTICSPRTKHSHNRHQISLSLSSSFLFCPLTQPCSFRPPFVPSLGVLDFQDVAVDFTTAFRLACSTLAKFVFDSWLLALCSRCDRLPSAVPCACLVPCSFYAGTAAAQQATSNQGLDRLKPALFVFRVRLHLRSHFLSDWTCDQYTSSSILTVLFSLCKPRLDSEPRVLPSSSSARSCAPSTRPVFLVFDMGEESGGCRGGFSPPLL